MLITSYDIKYAILTSQFPKIRWREFYRDIFPVGTFQQQGVYNDKKGNGILVSIKKGKARTRIILDDFDEIKKIQGDKFAFFSPISYFGKNRTSANGRFLHAMTFDLDGVSQEQLDNFFYQVDNEVLPKPTYVINSGGGVHLYYIFDKPIPLYPQVQFSLKEMKYELIRLIWNKYTSAEKKPQYQGIFQGFRVVGTWSKFGKKSKVVAFRTGEKVTIEYLNNWVCDVNKKFNGFEYKSVLSLAEAKKKYPDWYNRRIEQGEKAKKWIVKRALYDWWMKKISESATVGHRYFCIMCLAIYAVKCGIQKKELEKDAYGLLDKFNKLSANDDFTRADIKSALEMYNEHYRTFPRADIVKISGISISANKRNGRSQAEHLKRARAVQEIDYPNGEWRGRPSAFEAVQNYILSNPNAKKCDVIKGTGLSKPTVSKHYDAIKNNC